MLFCAILKFFLEDLSYRFLILYVSEREFVIEFWRSVVRGSCARARCAPDQCSRSAIMQEFCSRLSGSTIPVVREHNLALPARLSGSTTQVVRGHDSDSGCPGARFRFFLEDLSYRFLTRSVSKRDFVLHFGARLSRVPARARVLPIRAPDQQLCRDSARGCPGARFRLSGSTT